MCVANIQTCSVKLSSKYDCILSWHSLTWLSNFLLKTNWKYSLFYQECANCKRSVRGRNKIVSVITTWKRAFWLKMNSCMGGCKHCLSRCPLYTYNKIFGEHAWRCLFSVKIRLVWLTLLVNVISLDKCLLMIFQCTRKQASETLKIIWKWVLFLGQL